MDTRKDLEILAKVRETKIKRNLFGLGLLKVLSMILGFLLVPLSLKYLDTSNYGIWLTLSSIIGWVGMMDIGLGNSLRNQLGEAWAKKSHQAARVLVSTTYALLIFIVLIVNTLFWLINPFLDWARILNIGNSSLEDINLLVKIVFVFFTLRMVSGLITTILYADQRPAYANLVTFIGNLLSFIAIYVISCISRNSLIYLGTAVSVFPAVVPVIAGLWLFRRDYLAISPTFKFVDFARMRGLAGQGLQFFLLQIASIVLTMTDMVIITQLYGPEDVVPYNIAFRLFGYILAIFGVLTAPFWAAYNEAYHMKDFSWITRVTKKLLKLWVVVICMVTLLTGLSDYIYGFWIGDQVVVPKFLSICMGIYVIIQTVNSIFATFLFSTGKLRVLTFMAVFVGLINIPLCYTFAETMDLGTSGIIISTVVCAFLNLMVAIIQYFKIMNGRDSGVWSV